MKETYLIGIIVVAIIAIYLFFKLLKGTVKTIAIICVVLFVFGGGEYINTAFISSKQQEAVDKVVEKVGGDYIDVDGGKVLVKINDNWVNVNDIKIVGDFTKDVTIEYDGQEIPIGHSGVYNTIKVLKDMGMVKSKK